MGGFFQGTLALAGQPPVSSGSSSDPPDGFIAPYNPAGTCLWPAPSPHMMPVRGIALDAAGNVLVSGVCGTSGPTTALPIGFGNGITLTPGNYNGFLAKYNSQGIAQWARVVGDGSADSDAVAVATDATGAAFVCGTFGHDYGRTGFNTGTFGSYTLRTLYNSGYGDGYLAKYDAQGTCQWVQPVQGADFEWVRSLAVNQRGEVYLGGAAYGGVQFGGSTLLPAATFGYQGFVAKYSATGALRWLQGYGGSGTPFGASNRDAGMGLATDGVGHVYLCGAFQGNTSFGSIAVSGPNQSVNYPYLAALDDVEVLATVPGRAAAEALVAFPNPSTGKVQISWPATVRARQVVVLDGLGRTVRTVALSPAQTAVVLQLDGLTKGLYVLRLTAHDQVLTKKIMLE